MKQIKLSEISIRGNKIRTSNSKVDEIIELWQKVPTMGLEGNLYAVYYNYESDHHGEYDFLIGTSNYQEGEDVVLSEGNYLMVEIPNATPEKVGAAWHIIWEDKVIYEQRLFTADFEEYQANGQVTIHLAIK
ncbi:MULTISPECIES: GyrI-like domain-containing protein [Vagococcus]|uniref:GyrI-like domain-containing protein n=1 Tax=Vagococcus TaxID=2737 RepID=UPI002FCABF21